MNYFLSKVILDEMEWKEMFIADFMETEVHFAYVFKKLSFPQSFYNFLHSTNCGTFIYNRRSDHKHSELPNLNYA